MGKTGAERTREYREKLKADPERYALQKKKDAERFKKNCKKIKDMTEEEKDKKRKQWRQQKKSQKERKQTQTSSATSATEKSNNDIKADANYKIKYAQIKKRYKEAMNKITKYQTAYESLRKKMYRALQRKEIENKTLQIKNDKLEARHEVLELSLRETYNNCQSRAEKNILKKIPFCASARRTGSSALIAKCLGFKRNIKLYQRRIPVNKKISSEMEAFYNCDEISRCTAGKKECRTKNKEKKQIRYLTDTSTNLFKIYKRQGGIYSLSTFIKYRPYYVLSPNARTRDTCLCIKHSNFELLFKALKQKSVLTYRNVNELIDKISCNTKSYQCMYGMCDICKIPNIQYNTQDIENVTWYQWERVTHSYRKGGEELLTKKTMKKLTTGNVHELISQFQNQISGFRTHYFNWKEQQRQYHKCINELEQNEVLIICDFSENYDCKLAEEIQALHFGASKASITLHTGMVYWRNKSQSFVTISDSNVHEPHAIWAHLLPVIRFIRDIDPQLKKIHFFSDGPSSQYRQKKNFFLVNLFMAKFKLSMVTWSFSEAGHGKGVADGIGGAVKRSLDRQVAYGNDIINAADAFDNLQQSMKVVKCFNVSENDVNNMKSLVPQNLQTISGTTKIHQILSLESNQIFHRQLSCFCSKSLCDCYSPKPHYFQLPTPKSSTITDKDTSRDFAAREVSHVEHSHTMIEHNVEVSFLRDKTSKDEAKSKMEVSKNFPSSGLPNKTVTENRPEFTDLNAGPITEDVPFWTCDVEKDNETFENPETADVTSTFDLSENSLDLNAFGEPLHSEIDSILDLSQPTNLYNSLEKELGVFEKPVETLAEKESLALKTEKLILTSAPLTESKFINISQNCCAHPVPKHSESKPKKNKSLVLNDDAEMPKKKIKIMNISNENMNSPVRKPIKVSSRTFYCKMCNSRKPFNLNMMDKCRSCNNWFCNYCSSPGGIDYICVLCLSD